MPERADVVIVGGGIIGAACADRLAEAGADVLLLERHELAAGASGRNQGLHVMPRDPQLDEMARRSLACYLDVVEELPTPVGLDRRPIGYLLVATDADTPSDLPEGSRWLDGEELRDLEPALAPGLRGVWLADDGHRLDPTSLTVGLALRARGNGTRVRHHLSARALVTAGERVTGVVTDEGVIGAGTVVLAAGPWSPPLARPLGVRLAVNGVRGWIVHPDPGRPLTSRIVEEADLRAWRENVEPPTGGRFLGARNDLQIGSLITTAADGGAYLGASRESALRNEPDEPAELVASTVLGGNPPFDPAPFDPFRFD